MTWQKKEKSVRDVRYRAVRAGGTRFQPANGAQCVNHRTSQVWVRLLQLVVGKR